MAPSLLRKSSATAAAAFALLAAPVQADISYTIAAGYVQVTVPGSSLGAVSATLQNKSEHTSNAVINDDWADEVPEMPGVNPGDPPIPAVPAQQTLTVPGAGWSDGQWATGYLAYISDSDGGEEAFLVLSNTADTLTVATPFNLLDAARSIPSTTSISIRRAQTVGKLLGTSETGTDFLPEDRVYLWDGSKWITYRWINEVEIGGVVIVEAGWYKIGSGDLANADIVFADEGMFVQRNDADPITLTFFGDVPSKAQITTMPGPGLIFMSSRYPVDTTVGQLGFETLPDWQPGSAGDVVYLWLADQNKWQTYFYLDELELGGMVIVEAGWRKIGSQEVADADIVPADSALFVSRVGSSNLAESANQHELPYTP